MTRRIYTIILVIVLTILPSCNTKIISSIKKNIPDEAVDEILDQEQPNPEFPSNDNGKFSPNIVDENELLQQLGCEKVESGSCSLFVSRVCKSIVEGNKEEFASLIEAKSSDYDFLDNIKIDHYSMFSFYPTKDTQKRLENENRRINAQELYLVKFNVVESKLENINIGEYPIIISCFDLYIDAFSTIENAEQIIFPKKDTRNYDGYDFYFLNEFISLYGNALKDGINKGKSLSLENSCCLITHLMAKSGHYRSAPPYSAEEINEFISIAFDGHPNLNFSWEHIENNWTYPFSSYDNFKYGCTYAHGGVELEYEIISEKTNDGITTFKIQTYSDRSRINKAYKVLVNIKYEDGEIPVLISAEVIENTGRTAITAIY